MYQGQCEKCVQKCAYFVEWTPKEIEGYNSATINPDAQLQKEEGTCALDGKPFTRLTPDVSECLFPKDKR